MTKSKYDVSVWESLNEAQRGFLRILAQRVGMNPPDVDPYAALLHVEICLTCKEKMRIMNATGRSVVPPLVGHEG